jgi:hypothetical protein
MAQKRITQDDISDAVLSAGLMFRNYGNGHLQIIGGEKVVNMWPWAKRGFRFQVDGDKSRCGTVRDAVNAAGKSSKRATTREVRPYPHIEYLPAGTRQENIIEVVGYGTFAGVVLVASAVGFALGFICNG